jgi:hypothetical protein
MILSTGDVFAILAVLIALSAYLAIVRQRIYDKIDNNSEHSLTPEKRTFYEHYLQAITVGDFLVVTSTICFITAWLLKINQLSFLKCIGTTSEHWVALGILLYSACFG